MKKIPDFIIFIILIVLFFLGTILGGVLSTWGKLPPSFFDFKLTAIFQIVIISVIGCYVSYVLRVKSSKELKKSEMYVEIITDLQDKLVTAFESADHFMKNTQSVEKKELLSKHKLFSARLSFIDKMAKKNNLTFIEEKIDKIKEDFVKMREVLTEEMFEKAINKYQDERIRDYKQRYENIINFIYDMKIDGYK